MRVPNVPNLTIKLMLFPFSLEGAARIWLEKEPPRSILTCDDLVSKFINQFFPPSKTTNLRNEITIFQQRFDESFSEAWDRFNDLLRACPHNGFFELHKLDTFYNASNVNDQDSVNSAVGGNFLDKMPSRCLKIIESKSKDLVRALFLDKKNQSLAPAPSPTPAPVKAVEPNCVTCGGTHSYQNCPATSGNVYQDNVQEYVSQAAAANYSQGNTGFRPQKVNQPPAYQAPAYQAPIPQKQSVSQTDFERYVKANDAVLRNIQIQGQSFIVSFIAENLLLVLAFLVASILVQLLEYVLDRWSKSGENIWVDTSIDACESAIVHAIQQIFKDTVYRLVPFKHKLDLYQLELSDLLVKAEADIPVLMRVNKKDTFCSMLGVTEADRIVIKVPRHSKKQKAEGYNSITCPHKDEINAANKRAKRVTRSSSVNYKK
uniref:Reverse transcriptase domain-containing protein n=1 Tax=Tanacetum cinerariifolium TaxID=118510 RepID=A0A6L2NES6_TANCI|nr:reverse transcriptase domain-containing protein [Tanacetum cinerariifolium]